MEVVDAPLHFDAVPVKVPADGPLAVELVPAPDPWYAARRLAHLPNLLFLDSSERHGDRGRYSYVAAQGIRDGSPFEQARIEGLPPFQGGVAGLFGYGLCHELERIARPRIDEFQVPDQCTLTYPWVIGFDHAQGRAWIVASGYPEIDASRRRDISQGRIRDVMRMLGKGHPPPAISLRSMATSPTRGEVYEGTLFSPPPLWGRSTPSASEAAGGGSLDARSLAPQFPLPGFPGVTSNFDRAGYEAAVAKVVDYIRAGDCYQVNLSQRLLAPLREHPLDLYARLRHLNPAPFAAYFDMGESQILSASPERFLKVESGSVETRPIKGTRPRGRTPTEDAALIEELRSNAKDRAENVMIVDLLRNDLGRVCDYGSIRVPTVCEVESFRYVHHLVSEVRGQLRPECAPMDLLRAAFPGGSVTGAPKVRAMQIIAELEPTSRGPYCGSLGFIGFDGTMDSNILIRTFTAGRGWLQFPVGGGIVADSDPRREYEETLHKAAGLLRSLNPES
ncbi:MAG TPA: aminodeoxychorismate synthase component I [Gemmataceae bacterium]|jgi:para-aminobenzoate synthetase component 1